MSIKIYRRHTRACGQKDRDFLHCSCPLWMVGKTDKVLVPRQSAGTCDLREAEAMRAKLLAEGKAPEIHGPGLHECVEKYLASRAHELGERTYEQHELLLARLEKFCASRGIHFIQELNVDLLETFKVEGLGKLKDTSRATATGKLRCFLREAYRRGWVKESLAEKVNPHQATYEQKEPYTEEEVEKILAEAEKLWGPHGYGSKPRTFRLLLELMLATGMRVGDAVRYAPADAYKSERVWVYQFVQQKRQRTKAKKITKVFLSDELKTRIDECEWLSPARPFFYQDFKDPNYLAVQVYERMQSIGKRCGVKDCRPHRLRDTFAVRALLRGVSLEDVSRLLGHSSIRITETYYAKWVRARESRLESIVAETFMNPRGDRGGDR